jgi:hypothetical protein
MSDWRIQRKEACCASCERSFEAGEVHFSVLELGEDAVRRADACGACFGKRVPTEGEIFWRTRRRDERRGLVVDFEAVEGLFLALEARQEERLRELRYLLCLLLMRKRRVKLVRVARRPDGEVMIVRRPRRPEELQVQVFDLAPERAAALRADLEGLFEGAGLEAASAGDPDQVGAAAPGPVREPEA